MYNETILIVEDDAQIRSFISYCLKAEGFGYDVAGSGGSALQKLVSGTFDMMLLDLGLPDVDGMEVIRRVREWSEMPIIVVSARDQDKEKAAALDLGADDYLTKPFSATELLARIRVALRHLYKASGSRGQNTYELSGLKLDIEMHQVWKNGQALHLTPMEFDLLALFMKHAGKVLTTGFILKEIWGASYGSDTQALRALMAGLRRKIEETPATPRYILTEVGVGYRMADE